jgi:hypothetical protein
MNENLVKNAPPDSIGFDAFRYNPEFLIKHGRIDVLEHMNLTPDMLDKAICINVNIAYWMLEERCPFNPRSILSAAIRGYEDIIKILRGRGCEWHPHSYAGFITHGRVDLMETAFNDGCIINNDATVLCARAGHLEMMKWLVIRGYPVIIETLEEAQRLKNKQMLKWLLDYGCT